MCEVIAGQSPPGSSYNASGHGLPFYQGKKDFGCRYLRPPTVWSTRATKIAEAGDILMSVRAPVGPINVAPEQVCIGRGLAAIRVGCELDREYLWYALLHLQSQIQGKEGAVFPSISRREIEAVPIPLPPIEEQKRIAAILDQAFEGLARARENVEANLKNAREIFEGFLTSIFVRRDTSWEMVTLGNLCHQITVGHVGPMSSRYRPSGTPFLRSQNVRPFEIDLTNVKYIDEKFTSELKKSELRPGDVAIVRTGYPGTCAVIPEELALANCADLVIARTGPKLNPNFLAMLLNSNFGKSLVSEAAVGAAQKHFNVSAAKKSVIPLPPIQVQQKLVERCQEIRADVASLETAVAQKLIFLDHLDQGLLHKAFSGELT